MVFSSIMFIFIFLPAVLVLYYLFKPARNIILLIGSLLFYAWGEPVYVILLLFSATFNYIIGIDIDHARKMDEGENPFLKFAAPVVDALRHLGIDAEFTGRNDITVEGKKVSGNAQFRYGDRVLHHGNFKDS